MRRDQLLSLTSTTTEHSKLRQRLRDPSAYLFVNEGNETGNLIFGLCFPMASLDVEEPHLETGDGGGQAGHREGASLRASWARPVIVE